MEGRSFCVVLVMAAMLYGSSAQTTHTVGDSMGWTVPSGGEATYRTWAASKTFNVRDVLVFNFTTGEHDVAEVNKASYDSCNNFASPISLIRGGPARITLNSSGEHYYVCTIGRHCSLGQKVTIRVGSGGAPSPTSGSPASQPTPPSTPSTPSPGTGTPPPSNSASSVAVAALPLALLAVAMAVLHN